MKSMDSRVLKEVIQSGHLNLLIGAGCSSGYLGTLSDIENRMNNDVERESAQREYYKLIRKSKAPLGNTHIEDEGEVKNLQNTQRSYDDFLRFWANTITYRALEIVNKQMNIFTTNFDMFIELSCESLNIPYNDGFSNRINPVFDVANFNKIQKYKSMQFDNTSDIPLFNIIKLHGSLSWHKISKDRITYSKGDHIPEDLDSKDGDDFRKGYDEIAVINPNAEKHFETVLDTNYAALLRKFTLELEKENSVLLILGFSMNDKHIRNLLYGVMKSNPTLMVLYFSYEEYHETEDNLEEKSHPNLYIVSPKPNCKYSFEDSTDYLVQVFKDKCSK